MAYAQTQREPASKDGASKTKQKKETEKFLHDCVKKFARAEAREAAMREEALDDLRFVNGDQWPSAIKASRTIEKRPCLTINKLQTFVHQITNDQRQNRPSINVSPVGDRGDRETAKMLRGLIRQLERHSRADLAYDTAYESAVRMGWGYWRILTDYEDTDSFDQIIKIDRIANPFTVYMDPDAQKPEGSDANWCFITRMLPRGEFDDLYPKATVIPWQEGTIGDEYKNWSTANQVRVAEYFYKDFESKELVKLGNGHVGYESDLHAELARMVKNDPKFVVERRTARVPVVKWCKITAHEILEERDWPGKWIPVVRVIGEEINIEGKINYSGLVRAAKDPQRMYNYWVTSETELVALAPKAPFIMEEGQIEGHEQMWAQANQKSQPYLLYKASAVNGKPAPPPARQQFSGPPQGVVAAKIAAAQDMQAVTGIRFDSTLQERMYDESGKALRELKRVSDLGNFHFIDNLSRSLRFTGEQLVDLLPKVLDTPRIVTILREDDTEEHVKIDPSMAQPHAKSQTHDGRMQQLYNPKLGEYDVAVNIGPSFATKRAEAADSMLQFLKVLPNAAPIIGDLIAKNMDWPGAEEISTRLAAMLPPQIANKGMEQLPPEARGMVMNLMHQLQQLQQQHQQAVAMLGDKEKDRALVKEGLDNERQRINADVQTKLAKVEEDLKKAILQIEAKLREDKGGDGGAGATATMIAKLEEIDRNFQAKLIDIEQRSHDRMMDIAAKVHIAGINAKAKSQQSRSAKK